MPKHIVISDEVVRLLESETGDRRFSEVIEAHLASSRGLVDVMDQEIYDRGTVEAVKDDIGAPTSERLERFDEYNSSAAP